MPVDAELVTVVDPTTPTGGHIFKRTELTTKHMQSVLFRPAFGSSLSANVELGGHQFKFVSIRVNTANNSIFVSLLVHEPLTKSTGVVSLRRSVEEDGTFSYSRHCFNVLANPSDIEKNDNDEVNVHFVSIESITVDPLTGLWNDLRIAIDAVTAPLFIFKRRGRRPRSFVFTQRHLSRNYQQNHGGKFFHMKNTPMHNSYSRNHNQVMQYHNPHRTTGVRNPRRYAPRSNQDAAAQDPNSTRYARAAASGSNRASRTEEKQEN